MSIRIREQSGTDAARKFDYQMAVALDYLLKEFDNDVIVLIETLEDFAVFHNFGTDLEKIDIYQVKTKDNGLYTKNSIYNENVLGKIILTDFYYDSKANSLNIVCNTQLKGASTESLDHFVFNDTLTPNEISKLKDNVTEYLKHQPDFTRNLDTYIGKLIYIKSSLPFSSKEDRYSDTLVGKINTVISHHLNDDNHTINPQIVFNTLKVLIDKQRRNRFSESEVAPEEALSKKGVSTSQVKEIINKAAEINHLTKNEILNYSAKIFTPLEHSAIQKEYPAFLACKDNLTDHAFLEAKSIIEKEYDRLLPEYESIDELTRQVASNCKKEISYYSLSVIQILTIVTIYS